ncbi:MAG: 16S rRNA (cytosine(1402)-N(4))-methyltransferase RsmH [Candidatus Eisenbacteria bacterium]|uniref:Ribosomal RNA small subunit methyltransferase H n=1 Tax=Eiseniibacteriota bacterium TaxID=2212470 RepID=A0A538SCU8_UNCEI|nr:MAG: 16S rRNA (cytosine(1402)-N(4))-methyltransferase RsmH [Candidatus Eisenbacteria bacterium]
MESPGHVPVLKEEAVQLLLGDPRGTYVDATLGSGGHAAAILGALGVEGRLVGLDCDPAAVTRARAAVPVPEPRFVARRARFSGMRAALQDLGVGPVDGILADLGLSSLQLDDPARGFSFQAPGPLDMRLDPSLPRSAETLLRSIEDEELTRILRDLGEVPRPRAAVRAIRKALSSGTPLTGEALRDALDPLFRGPARPRRLSQIFQALRIAVNDELSELQALLHESASLLRPGGTLCVIAYHSLEDRIVKNAFRPPRPSDPNEPLTPTPWIPITKKPVRPSEEEVRRNPRARSAKLRAARRKEGFA